MTTTKQQKIRIGLFAVVTGALLALVLIVFAGLHFWKGKKSYPIIFKSSVIGLESGADVTYNGVKVGSVEDVGIDKDDVRLVRVVISVDDDTPIRTDTTAYLSMGGITGVKTLDLRSSEAHAPALAEHHVIPVGIGTLDKLTKQAEEIADHANAVMQHVDHIAQRADDIVDSVAQPMQEIMTTARSATASLAKAGAQLDATIGENRAAIHDTLAQVQQAAKTTTALLDNQVGGLASNASDVIAQLRDAIRDDNSQLHAAMVDIRQASRTFKELARDVRAKPSRLLFGSAPPERKLP